MGINRDEVAVQLGAGWTIQNSRFHVLLLYTWLTTVLLQDCVYTIYSGWLGKIL